MDTDAQSGPASDGVKDLVIPYESPLVDFSRIDYSVCPFDFMKCGKCGRICTKPELQVTIPQGKGCPSCGSLKLYAFELRRRDWWKPRVWWFVALRLAGRA